MVHELAEYERAAEHCHLTEDQLRSALFPVADGREGTDGSGTDPRPALFGHVAVDEADRPVGFALWFLNFSTWAGVHGIYLEDLYVHPTARGTGAGRRLLAALAAICVERGYQRLEWWMLDWNPAGAFYRAIGAEPMTEYVPFRLSGAALRDLAAGHGPAAPRPVPTP
ncbi:GNAT family N-acetyltransferase, partial [Micromonospora zhanjiangensis]